MPRFAHRTVQAKANGRVLMLVLHQLSQGVRNENTHCAATDQPNGRQEIARDSLDP